MAVTGVSTVVMITWHISMTLPDITSVMTLSCSQPMETRCQCCNVARPMTRMQQWTLDLQQVGRQFCMYCLAFCVFICIIPARLLM